MSLSSETLALAKSGDASSVNVVLSVATKVAKVVCQRYADNRSDIDDIAQNVAIKIYVNLSSCRAETHQQFLAYICQVTKNVCYDHHRATSRRNSLVMLCDELHSTFCSRDQESLEAYEILERAAIQLGVEDVVELSIAGCSQSEIGNRLGIPKRMVQRQLDTHRHAVQSMIDPVLV